MGRGKHKSRRRTLKHKKQVGPSLSHPSDTFWNDCNDQGQCILWRRNTSLMVKPIWWNLFDFASNRILFWWSTIWKTSPRSKMPFRTLAATISTSCAASLLALNMCRQRDLHQNRPTKHFKESQYHSEHHYFTLEKHRPQRDRSAQAGMDASA